MGGQFCTCRVPTGKCLVCTWIYRPRNLCRRSGRGLDVDIIGPQMRAVVVSECGWRVPPVSLPSQLHQSLAFLVLAITLLRLRCLVFGRSFPKLQFFFECKLGFHPLNRSIRRPASPSSRPTWACRRQRREADLLLLSLLPQSSPQARKDFSPTWIWGKARRLHWHSAETCKIKPRGMQM